MTKSAPAFVVPAASAHTLRTPAGGVPGGTDHGVVHTVTQNSDGICCPRTSIIPIDPATGVGTLHIDAATMLKSVGSSHPDLHNMSGVRIAASESQGMTGPSGVTFSWGNKENAVPFDCTTRHVTHTPGRTDLWHHLAHPSESKLQSDPIDIDLLSGHASDEDMGVAAATMVWDKSLPLEDHSDVANVLGTHKMFPKGKDSTLANMILNKNEDNPYFLGGKYNPQTVEHPESGAQMTVVTNAEYSAAARLAAESRAPKHMLSQTGGITITTRPMHHDVQANGPSPHVVVQWSTKHNNVLSKGKGMEMTAGQVRSVVSGQNMQDGAPAVEAPNIMSREDLAAHVGKLLNLGVAA
jgi:hypothetical protein